MNDLLEGHQARLACYSGIVSGTRAGPQADEICCCHAWGPLAMNNRIALLHA